MYNRKGISLVALIITIIVLIILVSAIMLSGIKTPANAQLAVFYNDVTMIQDAINIKMLENMQKYASDVTKDLDKYKWEGVLKEYNPEIADPIFIIYEGSYNDHAVHPISQDMKQIINIDDKNLSEYAVDENGVVYHKGLENENIIWYNRNESGNKINTYSVNIDATIQNGTVTADKTTDISEGETITLTITVDDGYEMITLIVDGENVTDQIVNGEYVIEMPDHSVIVTADIQEISLYSVTINPVTNGTVVADKTTGVNANEVVTLTTTVNEGYMLTSLVVDGIDVTNQIVNNEYAFSMPAHDVIVETIIGLATYSIEIDDDITNGTITASKTTGISPNEEITLTITPLEGYIIQSLIIDGTNVINELEGTQYIITVTNHNVIVDATFVLNSFNITIDDGITNGTVTTDKTTGIAAGEIVLVTVTPDAGYRLISLTVNGNDLTGYTGFYMPANNITITATFGAAEYEFRIDPNITHGTVIADKTTGISEGDLVHVTITPDSGYALESFVIGRLDGLGTQQDFTAHVSNGSITIEMPAVDLLATATFVQVTGTTIGSSEIPTSTVVDLSNVCANVTNWIIVGRDANNTYLITTDPVGSIHLWGYSGYTQILNGAINNHARNTVGIVNIAGATVRAVNVSDWSSYAMSYSRGMTYWIDGTWDLYYGVMCDNGSRWNQPMYVKAGNMILDNGGGQYPVRPLLTVPNGSMVQLSGPDENGVWTVI